LFLYIVGNTVSCGYQNKEGIENNETETNYKTSYKETTRVQVYGNVVDYSIGDSRVEYACCAGPR